MSAFTPRITFLAAIVLAVLSLPTSLAFAQTEPYGVASPTALNLHGAVAQTSAPMRVSLENTGESELSVSNISIAGQFAIAVNNCASAVKPGAHCDVYIIFSPKAVGTEKGTLTFTDNASNSPQIVALSGTSSTTAPTKTKLTASSDLIYAGQSITFTAAVTSKAGPIPDGEQVLFEGAKHVSLGYGTLHSGIATLTTSAIVWHSPYVYVRQTQGQQITAEYMGDQNFSSSQTDIDISVQRYSIGGYVASSPNPSVYCQPITFTPYIRVSGPYPATAVVVLTGDFFFPGSGSVGEPRTYNPCHDSGEEYAIYYGDPYNDWGETAGDSQVINPTTTTTTVLSSKNPSQQGKAVTFRVVVKAPFAHVVYGSVTFTSGATTLGTVQLSNSRGSMETSSLPAGQNTITATYTPSNGNYLGGSGSLVQTVE